MSVHASDASAGFRFVVSAVERRADLRGDEAAVAALAARDDARFLVVIGGRIAVATTASGETAFHTRATAERLGGRGDGAILLGLAGTAGRFAVGVPGAADDEERAAAAGVGLADLRALAIAGSLEAGEYGAIAAGRAMLSWHESHRFCARCGQPSTAAEAGWKRVCASCGAEHFPRTDPVVIMSIEHGDRCLLGRSARFPPGMWSCLAGFMEPGETIEAAVRRETFEEAGIAVGRVGYLASEPWPFPGSLMIGLRGEALDTTIRRDESELEDCRWFDRAEVALLLDGRHPDGLFAPPPIAIAHHLMRVFVDAG